jgi:hypothetical protein
LFFAPHSALWVHAFPEALIAEALSQSGHEVTYITCGRLYRRFCVPMSAHRLAVDSDDREKDRVCGTCVAHKQILEDAFGFRGADAADLVTVEDRERAAAILRTTPREALLELRIDGIPIGKLASYEFMLDHKKQSFDFTEREWDAYLVALENSLLTLFLAHRLVAEKRPDRLVVYNALYSVNRTFCEVAEAAGIPTYFLHAGGNLSNRLQALMLGRRHTVAFFEDLIGRWKSACGFRCPPEVMSIVTDHFLALFEGQHFLAYSPEKQNARLPVRERFGVPDAARLLVATLSSYDERIAGEAVGAFQPIGDILFPRQVDWIRETVDFVRSRPDLFLLIRVHPREFPNKREFVKSEHARLLEQLFQELPLNVKVNWPSDGVSLYDLAEEADLFLNAWSSVGKEMTLLGLPVLIYSPELLLYPADLNYVGDTRATYFRRIDEALAAGWNLERVRMAYRWYALEFKYALIDISESYEGERRPGSLASRAAARAWRLFDPYHAQHSDCRRRAPRLQEAEVIDDVVANARESVLGSSRRVLPDSVSQDEETAGLLRELGRIAAALGGSARAGSRSRRLSDRLAQISETHR